MSGRITLTLRDDVLRRAKRIAKRTGQPVAELLADAIDNTLDSAGPQARLLPPVVELNDADLLSTADSMMAAGPSRRLSQLLAAQREGKLSLAQRTELVSLMQVYQFGLLRKAEAIAEAVRRGLRGPPAP